jgi:hypothetical protein
VKFRRKKTAPSPPEQCQSLTQAKVKARAIDQVNAAIAAAQAGDLDTVEARCNDAQATLALWAKMLGLDPTAV